MRKKKVKNEKEKIGIEKLTFYYVELGSREQQVAKETRPPQHETMCQILEQIGEPEPLAVGCDVTLCQAQPMEWWYCV